MDFYDIGEIKMAEEGFDTLVSTLISNHLAASQTEANRMAEEMLGTSKKVNESFQKQRHHYAAKNFSPESSTVRTEATVTKSLDSETKSDLMKQKIQELRERAINPEPVNVQVDFDTRKVAPSISQSLPPVNEEFFTQVQENTASASNPQENSWMEESRETPEIDSEKEIAPETESVVAEPVLTPEEYSAQNMSRGISLAESLEEPKATNFNEPVKAQEEITIPDLQFDEEPAVEQSFQNDSNYDGFPRPDSNDKKQFVKKISSFLKSEPILEPVLNSLESNPQFQKQTPLEKTQENVFSNEQTTPIAQEQNDFLSLKQEPNENPLLEEVNNQTVPPNSIQATETIPGWPPSPSQEAEISRPNENQQEQPVQVQAQEEEQIVEKTQELPAARKRPELTAEEKKLREDVDITKIFNFGNR